MTSAPPPLKGASPYGRASEAAGVVAALTGIDSHQVGVILGSGWAAVADALGPPTVEIPLAELGGSSPGVAGHAGVVRSVPVAGRPALVFVGRVHAYEGHDLDTVVHPVRTAVAAGCEVIVLTNAAGAVNTEYRVGQPVLISDHLNLTGRSPLSGPSPPANYSSRFLDLSDLYDAALRGAVTAAAGPLAAGVYAGLSGPHYETPAEIRMLRTLGADLVGMSTVHEAIAARHLGARVLGISLVTNAAAGTSDVGLSHAEVMAAGQAASAELGGLLATVLHVLAGHPR